MYVFVSPYSQYYANSSNDFAQKTLNNPKVGDYCSACFSEDNCWYRAKITELIELSEGWSHVCSTYMYVYVLYCQVSCVSLLTLGAHAYSEGYYSCPVCVYVRMCVHTNLLPYTLESQKRYNNGFITIQESFLILPIFKKCLI